MSYVITKLVKSLKRGGVIDLDDNILEGSKFYELFAPDTLRLVASKEFAETALKMEFDEAEVDDHWHTIMQGRRFYFECGQVFTFEEDPVELKYGVWYDTADIDETRLIIDLHGGRVLCEKIKDAHRTEKGWAERIVRHLTGTDRLLVRKIAYLASTLDDDMKMPPIQIGVPKGMPGGYTSSFLTFCSLRSYTRSSSGEHTALDRHGVRRHWVRPFDRDIGKPEKSKVRGHWRGDPRLGIVRKVFVAKGTADETPTT